MASPPTVEAAGTLVAVAVSGALGGICLVLLIAVIYLVVSRKPKEAQNARGDNHLIELAAAFGADSLRLIRYPWLNRLSRCLYSQSVATAVDPFPVRRTVEEMRITFPSGTPLGIGLIQKDGKVIVDLVQPTSAAAAVPVNSTIKEINGTSCEGKGMKR